MRLHRHGRIQKRLTPFHEIETDAGPEIEPERAQQLAHIDRMSPRLRALVNEHGYNAVTGMIDASASDYDVDNAEFALDARHYQRQQELANAKYTISPLLLRRLRR